MAKDKSEKKSKAEKATVVNDDFGKPSEAPATSDGWNFENDENVDKLYLITPLKEEAHPDTFSKIPGGTKQHIVADIVEINRKKPEKSELHENAWVFGGWTLGSLRGFIGKQRVLGILQRDPSKAKGGNIPWVLTDATSDDVDAAKAYLASIDPFKVK